MAPEALHTVAELAKAWRCSRNHIYDLIVAGRLRSVDIGIGRAKTRIPQSAIDEFEQAQNRDRKARRAAA